MRSTLAALSALLLTCFPVVHATEPSPSGSSPSATPLTPAALLMLLTQRFPNIHFGDIHPSSTIPGWLEISTDSDLVYSDPTGEHLFIGYIVDTKTRANLTAQRWAEMNIVDFEHLPFERAIKTVRGNGSRQLAIFEDPLCPYCRQLEKNMADLNDVTIYTFLFPLESVHAGATMRSRQIWCSADRSATWSAWMSQPDGATELPKGMNDSGSCGNDPIPENRALAHQLHINATPTLIFPDGSRIAAAVSKEDVEKRLAQAATATAATKVTMVGGS
jgi:thiol:disulfide interchange protein DsbC